MFDNMSIIIPINKKEKEKRERENLAELIIISTLFVETEIFSSNAN